MIRKPDGFPINRPRVSNKNLFKIYFEIKLSDHRFNSEFIQVGLKEILLNLTLFCYLFYFLTLF